MSKFIGTIKRHIIKEIDAIKSVEESLQQASKTVILDQASTGRLTRMDALQQQAMAQENQRRSVLRMKQLHAALDRIENDEYGFCVECDEEIPPKRLEANPVTTLCIGCAEEKEK